MPEERADSCPEEYVQAIESWGGVLDQMAALKGKIIFVYNISFMVTYTCELCGFSSIYSTRYRDHCMTRKHLRNLDKFEKEKIMVCKKKINKMTPK